MAYFFRHSQCAHNRAALTPKNFGVHNRGEITPETFHSTASRAGREIGLGKLRAMYFLRTVPLLLLLPLLAAKAPKPPDLTVVEFSATRGEELIGIDASVRNTGVKPINEGVVIFHFFSPEHEPLTTQRTQLEERVLDPGASSAIHAQMANVARAVTVEVDATDAAGHTFRMAAGGPFPIE